MSWAARESYRWHVCVRYANLGSNYVVEGLAPSGSGHHVAVRRYIPDLAKARASAARLVAETEATFTDSIREDR